MCPFALPRQAIVAELSQIYDGDRRRANTVAALKNSFDDIGPSACGESGESIKKIFADTERRKACWGFNVDYRLLYCKT